MLCAVLCCVVRRCDPQRRRASRFERFMIHFGAVSAETRSSFRSRSSSSVRSRSCSQPSASAPGIPLARCHVYLIIICSNRANSSHMCASERERARESRIAGEQWRAAKEGPTTSITPALAARTNAHTNTLGLPQNTESRQTALSRSFCLAGWLDGWLSGARQSEQKNDRR